MEKSKFFRVKVGYGNDDYITIDDTELSKCLRAQFNGSMVICKEGSISGKSIITITPDVNKIMGWNRGYQPTPEDYGDAPQKLINEHRELLENTMLQITGKAPDEHKSLPPSQFSKELSDKFKI
jgi:hypothetical protein